MNPVKIYRCHLEGIKNKKINVVVLCGGITGLTPGFWDAVDGWK